MTELLFYKDPYLKEAKAKVVKIFRNIVWLDRTIFYGEKGGQESDRGWINDYAVVYVNADDLSHQLDKVPDFNVGDEVHLRLDWERRYRIMRLHSALHLVYFVTKEILGELEVIGSHVGSERARIDYRFEGSIGPYIPEIEKKVNEVILADKEIIIYEPRPGWRIWKLDNWEDPCAGTHVKRTGEIGQVKLKRRNLGKGKERIEVTLVE